MTTECIHLMPPLRSLPVQLVWAIRQVVLAELGYDCYRVTTDRWRRRWQCEWPGAQRAVRAWTLRGLLRRAQVARRRELS